MGGRRRGRGALLPTGEGREGKGIRENREGKEREEPGRKGGGEEGTGIGPQFEKNDPPPVIGWLVTCLHSGSHKYLRPLFTRCFRVLSNCYGMITQFDQQNPTQQTHRWPN